MYIFRKDHTPDNRLTRIYLETSALNFIYDTVPEIGDALATKAVQLAKGNILYISPVVIWEIMLISDDEHRENLLTYCAHLCDLMMPKSPAELILDNILAKGEHVTYNDFSTNLQLGQVWKEIYSSPNQTIGFNKESMKILSDSVKKKAKRLNSLIDSFIFNGQYKTEEDSVNSLIAIIYSKIDYPNKNAPEWHTVARKLAILLLFLIVCEGIDLDGELVDTYWAKFGINNPFDRLLYLAVHCPMAFYSGPITFMAAVVSYQHLEGKANRGAIHDGLHMGYLPYFDVFLTNDKLLGEMQSGAKPAFYDQYSKVRLISGLDHRIRAVRVDKPHPLL